MSTRFHTTFERLRQRGEGAFVPFVMLGDPDRATSVLLIERLVEAGADMLELGVPFSDPPGDGPTIQAASQRALASGMTTAGVFDIVRDVRRRSMVPISLLCYYNVVLQYGVEEFYRDAAVAGVDAVLVADVSLEESSLLVTSARCSGVHPVFMVSEVTTDERLGMIAEVAGGYVYLVAHVGVTGERGNVASGLAGLLERCRRRIGLPVLAGFGISTPDHVRAVIAAGVDGVICGSAIVRRVVEAGGDVGVMRDDLGAFVAEMKAATLSGMGG